MGETPKAARREERARLPRFFNLLPAFFNRSRQSSRSYRFIMNR